MIRRNSELDWLLSTALPSSPRFVGFLIFLPLFFGHDHDLSALLQASNGLELFQRARERILASIKDNFERKHVHDHEHGHDDGHHGSGEGHHKAPVREDDKDKAASGEKKKTPLLHDSEGFRCLETSMKILLNSVAGLGTKFAPMIDAPLLDIVKESLHHTNRYVRETGYFVCRELFASAAPENLESLVGPTLGPALAAGLDDNWSEVRFAASGALRELFVKGAGFKSQFYEVLVPRMVLLFPLGLFFFFFFESRNSVSPQQPALEPVLRGPGRQDVFPRDLEPRYRRAGKGPCGPVH